MLSAAAAVGGGAVAAAEQSKGMHIMPAAAVGAHHTACISVHLKSDAWLVWVHHIPPKPIHPGLIGPHICLLQSSQQQQQQQSWCWWWWGGGSDISVATGKTLLLMAFCADSSHSTNLGQEI